MTMQLQGSGTGLIHAQFINAGTASSKSQGASQHPPRTSSQLAHQSESFFAD